MKRFYLLLAVLTALIPAMAQSTLLATLSHEGELSTYYGIDALKDAYASAANGDVITLSSGQFNATDIAKAVTIRGAGMQADTTTQLLPTIIQGDFTISAPEEATSETLTLEGFYHNSTIYYGSDVKGQIIKCRLLRLLGRDAVNTSLTIINTRIVANVSNTSSSNSIVFINSIIYIETNTISYIQANNCFIKAYICNLANSLLHNCIIEAVQKPSFAGEAYILPSSTIAYYCLEVNGNRAFNNIRNSTNIVSDGLGVFSDYTGTYADDITFELTPTAAANLLGSDGTQRGIYGGPHPYNTTPSNPQIKKFNVASKTTADGKLSIDIEISLPE